MRVVVRTCSVGAARWPGDACRDRASKSAVLPAPPGPTSTTLRMSCGEAGLGAAGRSDSAGRLAMTPPFSSDAEVHKSPYPPVLTSVPCETAGRVRGRAIRCETRVPAVGHG